MKKLLLIDPQNDFCDQEAAALPVPGACADLTRLSEWMGRMESVLDDIIVTFDSHPSVAIERTSFWQDAEGRAVAPYTFVRLDDVVGGNIVPRQPKYRDAVIDFLRRLSERGSDGLIVWPVHCVLGTWGHNLYAPIAEAIASWERTHQRVVHRVLKGEAMLNEHFGVFEAEVPTPDIPATMYHVALAERLLDNTTQLIVAGEAASHCVAKSVEQLLRYARDPLPEIVLLTDCMSPVSGFEAQTRQFFDRLIARGIHCRSSHDTRWWSS